jgi:TolB-like protein
MQNRQLSAIMFTDIVGYTALMGEDELKAFELLHSSREIHLRVIREFDGTWIKELGDGVLASFHTASDAVYCAVSIQQECVKIPGLILRIGIHLGEVVFENNDVFGDGVNIASRLQAEAPAGAIWISEPVYQNIANKKEISTKYIKEEILKHVKDPVRIYEVQLEGTGSQKSVGGIRKARKRPLSKTPLTFLIIIPLLALIALAVYLLSADNNKPSDKSIAVLYFDNMSGDPGQDYFSDGITEEIITDLSKLQDLRVISRTSVLPYKGKGKNIKDIARELNVTTVLEGSVRRAGNRVRITAQLIDAVKDKHLWSEEFERELKDIFEIQSSVAKSIADKFEVQLSPALQTQINNEPTSNSNAYDYYLKAKAEAFKERGLGIGSNTVGRDRAVVYLKKAIQLDPKFTKALALLANIYSNDYFVVPGKGRLLDSAIEIAQKAIDYNTKEVDGYLALANALRFKYPEKELSLLRTVYKLDPPEGLLALSAYYEELGNFPEAIKYLSAAIRTQSNRTEPYISKARIYNHIGLGDSSLKYFKKAKDLDPLEKEIFGWEMAFYQFKGEVEPTIKAASVFFGDDSIGYNKEVAIAYLFHKDWKNAEKYYKRTNYRDMDYALVLWKTGRKDSGMIYADKAIDFRKRMASPWSWDLSRLYAFKNDVNKAVYYFNKGIKDGTTYYDWIKNDPYWDEIRNTPEFKKAERDFDKRNANMIRQIQINERNKVVPDIMLEKS